MFWCGSTCRTRCCSAASVERTAHNRTLLTHFITFVSRACSQSLRFLSPHSDTQDQVLQRSFCMERMSALAATPDGAYLAAGGASGTVYLWEVASGRLLRSWPAHYKVSRRCLQEGMFAIPPHSDNYD